MPPISSTHNPRVKQIRALQSRKERQRTGHFFVEGVKALQAAVRCGAAIETLVIATELLHGPQARALADTLLGRGLPCLDVTADVFRSLAAKHSSHGLGAVVRQRWQPLARIQPGREGCWVALDAIQYPGNLGTILRTCEATGADGAILLGATSDPYDPESVRASVGAVFALELARASPAEFAAWKRARGIAIVGTSPAARLDYRAATYAAPVVLLMGCERSGLSPAMHELCDVLVRIPMIGRSDSLNLAVATSLMLYEVFRQRRPLEPAG
jgi:TrmH family RNA methyltransferase